MKVEAIYFGGLFAIELAKFEVLIVSKKKKRVERWRAKTKERT